MDTSADTDANGKTETKQALVRAPAHWCVTDALVSERLLMHSISERWQVSSGTLVSAGTDTDAGTEASTPMPAPILSGGSAETHAPPSLSARRRRGGRRLSARRRHWR